MIKTDRSQQPKLNDILLDVLVCPKDHADLTQQGAELVCDTCEHRYPIVNSVPNMLLTNR